MEENFATDYLTDTLYYSFVTKFALILYLWYNLISTVRKECIFVNRLQKTEWVVMSFLASLLTQGVFAVWLITNHTAYTFVLGVIAVVFQIVFWVLRYERTDSGSGIALTFMLEVVGVIAVYVFHLKGVPIGYAFAIALLIAGWEYACMRADPTEGTETAKTDETAETAETTETDKVSATTMEDETVPPVIVQFVPNTAPLLPLLVAAGIAGACVLVTMRKKK